MGGSLYNNVMVNLMVEIEDEVKRCGCGCGRSQIMESGNIVIGKGDEYKNTRHIVNGPQVKTKIKIFQLIIRGYYTLSKCI